MVEAGAGGSSPPGGGRAHRGLLMNMEPQTLPPLVNLCLQLWPTLSQSAVCSAAAWPLCRELFYYFLHTTKWKVPEKRRRARGGSKDAAGEELVRQPGTCAPLISSISRPPVVHVQSRGELWSRVSAKRIVQTSGNSSPEAWCRDWAPCSLPSSSAFWRRYVRAVVRGSLGSAAWKHRDCVPSMCAAMIP